MTHEGAHGKKEGQVLVLKGLGGDRCNESGSPGRWQASLEQQHKSWTQGIGKAQTCQTVHQIGMEQKAGLGGLA
jgi:hypothetical protein